MNGFHLLATFRRNIKRRPRVFVSYVRQDLSAVQEITNALAKGGLDMWIDLKGIEAGANWEKKIEAEIEKSDVFIVFFTESYFLKSATTYVNKEIEIADRVFTRDELSGQRKRLMLPISMTGHSLPNLRIQFKQAEKLPKLNCVQREGCTMKTFLDKILTSIEGCFDWRRKDITLDRDLKIACSIIILFAAGIPTLLWGKQNWSLWEPAAHLFLGLGIATIVIRLGLFLRRKLTTRHTLSQDGGWAYILCLVFNMSWFLVSTGETGNAVLVSQHVRHLSAQAILFAAAIAMVLRYSRELRRPVVVRIDSSVWSWMYSILLVLLSNLLALLDSHYQHRVQPTIVSEQLWHQWVYFNNTGTIWAYLIGALVTVWVGRLFWVAMTAFIISFGIFITLFFGGTH